MDNITALAIAGAVPAVLLVVGVVVEYREWKLRRRAETAAWVLRGLELPMQREREFQEQEARARAARKPTEPR